MSRADSAAASTRLRTALAAIAASSVAPVASGYERSLRPCAHGVLARSHALSVAEATRV